MAVIAEFRRLIEPAIPWIANLRKGSDREVHWAGTVIFLKRPSFAHGSHSWTSIFNWDRYS